MNYYNPYFYTMPTATQRIGIFKRLTGINFSSILNGTQRALNFANQAIPLVKEVKPMIGNAKTMFKVMNEFKRVEKPNSKNNNIHSVENTSNEETIENIYNEGPKFFI